MVIRVILFGDFAPVGNLERLKLQYDTDNFDLALMNLETPLVNDLVPSPKAGPSLCGDKKIFYQFANEKFVINLANNHTMDYGETGLTNTINICQNIGINTVGAGKNISEASKPFIQTICGIKVGIISYAETQFGMANPRKPGVSPIIHGTTEKQIHELSKKVDVCIVSIHGEAEMCSWPSPEWQDLLRGFIDAGATIVYGHHSHVPQGYEEYNKGLIFYGLGNFLVNPNRYSDKNALWSLVPEIIVSKNGIEEYRICTSVIDACGVLAVRKSDKNENKIHNYYLSLANKPLSDKKQHIAIWQEVSIRMYYLWNAKWLGFENGNNILRKKTFINKVVSYFFIIAHQFKLLCSTHKNVYSIDYDKLRLRYVLLACESHHNAITTALGVLCGELEDLRTEETHEIVDKMMPWSSRRI